MGAQYIGYWEDTVEGDTYVYEDKKTGIVFTTDGSLPDSDEIEHVEDYHAGKFCPIVGTHRGCVYQESVGIKDNRCYDKFLAGKW